MEKKSSPPKKLNIKGQPHHLAYINDVEDGLLRALGGSGEKVNGIPSFFMGEGQDSVTADTYSGGDTFSGGGSGDDDEAFSEYAGVSDAAKQAAINKAESALQQSILEHGVLQSGMTPEDFAFDAGPSNADRVAQSYFDYADVFGPEIYSSNYIGGSLTDAIKNRSLNSLLGVPSYSSWFDHAPTRQAFANMAIDRVQNRIDGYNNDQSFLGQKMAPINSYFANNIIKGLQAGGRPVLDATGRVAGVFNKSPLGFGEVYTGTPVEGVVGTGFDNIQFGGTEDVKPPNPLTGQCEEGYVFDEDLQACRVDTGSSPVNGDPADPSDGAYYRPTGLEDAPANLPAGVDYDALNKQFIDTYAYRPTDFVNPMSLNGFVKV